MMMTIIKLCVCVCTKEKVGKGDRKYGKRRNIFFKSVKVIIIMSGDDGGSK